MSGVAFTRGSTVHGFPQQLTVCDFLHVDASSQSSGSAA